MRLTYFASLRETFFSTSPIAPQPTERAGETPALLDHSPSTSSVCSPIVGGSSRIEHGVFENLSPGFIARYRPSLAISRSSKKPTALKCGSSNSVDISFARIAGTHTEGASVGTKVIVLKALGGDPKLPYFALVAQGFPRLVTITRENMIVDSAHLETLPEGIRLRVMFNDDVALVPDLDAAEKMIVDVLRPAA